jgi:hypothetical protein
LVKSVKTVVRSGIVCVASFQPPDHVIDDAVEVQFYSEPNALPGFMIGKVLYVHAQIAVVITTILQ